MGHHVIRPLADVVVRPQTALAALAREPRWAVSWVVLLMAWALCGGLLLATDVGRQALVDERVRVVEVTGGTVTDAEYAALQANPPWLVYFTSGGRLLLAPPVTLTVAAGLWAVARVEGKRVAFRAALAIAVHVTVVLVLGQIVATPLNYVRESLTSPTNLAALLPLIEADTPVSRFFGTLDVFVLWWAGLLAVGLSALTGRPVARYAWPIGLAMVAFAAAVALAIALLGGS